MRHQYPIVIIRTTIESETRSKLVTIYMPNPPEHNHHEEADWSRTVDRTAALRRLNSPLYEEPEAAAKLSQYVDGRPAKYG